MPSFNDWIQSPYCDVIYQHFKDTEENLIINACPGSGKTTACAALWHAADTAMVYLVFNKANAVEAQGKLHVKHGSLVSTFHSLGYKAINNAMGGRVTVNESKVAKLTRSMFPFTREQGRATYKQAEIRKLVHLAKNYGSADTATLERIQDEHDLDSYAGVITHAQEVYHASLTNMQEVDFADMLLFPVYYGMDLPHYKIALIDESQDLSEVQASMLGGIADRYVFVGDRRQAIYAFRGALSGSMQHLQDAFNCIPLPLKRSYRCPQLVVVEAVKVYPDDIEALPTAEDGIVRSVNADKRMEESYKEERDTLLLCRNSAPVVRMAHQLLQQRIPVQMIGRDFGKNMSAFIKRLGGYSVRDMLYELDTWREQEEQLAKERDKEHKLESINDKYETVHALASMAESNDLNVLFESIDALFSMDYGIKLSTIHRAKGLEAQRVYFLDRHLIPSKWCRGESQLEQENNLLYVGITRAKHELVYLEGEKKNGHTE